MDHTRDMEAQGPFDVRYLAFLETITQLRARLHRYCSRMTGSVMDGEDVVQEALFEAYRKLDQYDESRPLAPWIFKIAHNRCIDLLTQAWCPGRGRNCCHESRFRNACHSRLSWVSVERLNSW